MSGDERFLSRWARLKREARKPPEEAPSAAPPVAVPAAQPEAEGTTPPPPAELPPITSLTPESDFAPFMKPEVDGGLRRQALKTLFQDPRYNVMDGLDVYIDDYSKPDPLPEGWLEKMTQMARLGAYEPPEEKAARAEAEAKAKAEAEAAAAAGTAQSPPSAVSEPGESVAPDTTDLPKSDTV
jgi:uncharacterized protein DUF3306